ncbi:hypothetical protein Bca4012_037468 [Brassica carinata]
MPEFPILCLPTDLQGLVMRRVAHNSCEDLFRLGATCKSMRALTDDAEVYASLDMFRYPWRMPMFMLRPLLRRCYQEGNPSTLYIKGVEFFYRQDRGFTRETVAKIAKVVRNSEGIWNIDHNEDFLTKRHVFISTIVPMFYNCPCSPILDRNWVLYHIEDSKAEDMCIRCFWIKEVALFLRDFNASIGHPDFDTWL